MMMRRCLLLTAAILFQYVRNLRAMEQGILDSNEKTLSTPGDPPLCPKQNVGEGPWARIQQQNVENWKSRLPLIGQLFKSKQPPLKVAVALELEALSKSVSFEETISCAEKWLKLQGSDPIPSDAKNEYNIAMNNVMDAAIKNENMHLLLWAVSHKAIHDGESWTALSKKVPGSQTGTDFFAKVHKIINLGKEAIKYDAPFVRIVRKESKTEALEDLPIKCPSGGAVDQVIPKQLFYFDLDLLDLDPKKAYKWIKIRPTTSDGARSTLNFEGLQQHPIQEKMYLLTCFLRPKK